MRQAGGVEEANGSCPMALLGEGRGDDGGGVVCKTQKGMMWWFDGEKGREERDTLWRPSREPISLSVLSTYVLYRL